MFFAIYNTSTGSTIGASGPDMEWAQGEAAARGEEWAVLETDHRVDNATERVDLSVNPPVLVSIVPELTPSELLIGINQERDRRLQLGKQFGDIYVTGNERDITNLTNLALGAQIRLGMRDTTTTTRFRDGNNVDHMLAPAELLDLWEEASAYVSALYEASWNLKSMTPIPQNFTDDSYWP